MEVIERAGGFMIEFCCQRCSQKIKAQDKLSGKRVKCPKCSNIVVVPKAENAAPVASQSNFSNSKISTKHSDLDPALFDIQQKGEAANQLRGQSTASEKGLEELKKLTEKTAAEEGEQIDERKLPCFIDIFLYPVSFSGLLNLAIFIGVP
ncbi:MAG: hypothetical protein ACYS83_01920, partial [Planctomycetota bacterium]